MAATYSYDRFGVPTIWESFSNGWHNPFLYDGHNGARYDSETGLYWLSVRAYNPTLGRFISCDPLGRAPLFFDASQGYAYGGNNPLVNVDPSGHMAMDMGNSGAVTLTQRTESWASLLPSGETQVPVSSPPLLALQQDGLQVRSWTSSRQG